IPRAQWQYPQSPTPESREPRQPPRRLRPNETFLPTSRSLSLAPLTRLLSRGLPVCMRFNLLAVSLLARFNRVSQRVALPVERLAPLIHHIGCLVTQFRRPLLQEFLALTGFIQQNVTCFLPSLGGKQEPEAHTQTQTEEEIRYSVFVHFRSLT